MLTWCTIILIVELIHDLLYITRVKVDSSIALACHVEILCDLLMFI